MDSLAAYADTIDSAVAHTCRTQRLGADDAEEFTSWARLRLLENGQAVVAKFEHRSSLRTYLIVVVQRLYLDWRNAEWGKWRPTTDARRLGPVAIELERLVLRDGLTYDEAVQTLVSRHATTARACDELWAQLPRRPWRRRVGEDDLFVMPGRDAASQRMDDDEASTEARRMCAALHRALAELPESDRLLLQLRYWSRQPVSRIAEMTGQDQRALYSRFAKLSAGLRRRMEGEGLSGQSLRLLEGRFGEHGSAELPQPVSLGNSPGGPSTLTSTGGKND